MKKVNLGKTDMLIAPLIFGGNVFGWTANKETSFQLLDHFAEQGFNCIDTADVYSNWVPGNSGGESEAIIGEWMKERGNRNQMIIATKVGMEMGAGKKGLSRKYIKEAAEASLKRLQTDYIDLYISHMEDTETAIEETLQAHDELVKEGKVRHIGASNYSPKGLSRALEVSHERAITSYSVLQPLYNLYDRADFEKELAPFAQQKGLGVIPYYSLASGFLTGKYRSEEDLKKSQRGQGVKRYLDERGFKILNALDLVAKETNSSLTQVAIAWLNHNEYVTAALASATKVEQLKELIKGAGLKLNSESIEVLNSASSY